MVSTLTILFASGLSLFLVWTILRSGPPKIKSVEDWEANKNEVDPEIFSVLLDPSEEKYLRQSLSPREFRLFQRKRIGLALRWLHQVGENAAMLMKLGQLAKTEANPRLASKAEELIYGALRLRVNSVLAQPCLWLQWMLPGSALSLPKIEIPYEELLTGLNRMRQVQPVEFRHALS